jgi:4-oxalocrotonate tautomerase
MPYVNIRITRGPEVTREVKTALVAGVTRLLAETLGKKPEQTHIIVDEVDEDNWGFSGMLTTDYRRQAGS